VALSGAQTFNAAAGDLVFESTIANDGSALTIVGSSNTILSGTVTGTGNFTKNGAGTLSVPGNVLSTGRVNFNQGTSMLAGAVSPGTSELWVSDGAGNESVLNVSTGATVTVSNWLAIGRTGAKGTMNVDGGVITRAGSGNLTLGTLGTTPLGIINLNSGSISNLTGETYIGEGSSTFNFGSFNQSGGTAHLGNLYLGRGASGGQGIGTATLSGGTMTAGNIEIGFGFNNTRVGTNVMSIGAGATVNAAGHVRLAFAGSSSLWGILTNNGGTLNIGATALYMGYWPDGCSGRLTLNSGAINLYNNASIIFGQNGNAGPGNVFIQNGGNVTFYSDAGVTVGGSGSLNLGNSGAGSHTYTLAGGMLTAPQIRKAGGTSTATFNFNGGILRPTADSATFLQGLSAANVQSGGVIIDTAGKNITVAQPLLDGSSGGGLTKLGTGTLTLSGNNTYAGSTKVNEGGLAVSGGNAIGDSSSVILSNAVGVILSLNSSETIGSLAGGGTTGGNVTLGANTLSVGGNNLSSVYSGILSGTGGFTKNGGGTLTLTGTNTYSGPTVVNAGTLRLEGNLNGSGSVTVGAPGVLVGSGIINGVTTIIGQIAPGTSVGTLTFSNTLTLGSSSVTVMELNRTNSQNADLLIAYGSLTRAGTLTITNLGDALVAGDAFNLFDAPSFTGTFVTVNLPTLGSGLEWDFSQFGTDGILSVMNEPLTYTRLKSFGYPDKLGHQPIAELMEGSDGKLYGTTVLGSVLDHFFGPLDDGSVFSVNKDGSGYTVLHLFTGNGVDGLRPYGHLIESTNGWLYGTTHEGGISNRGTIFTLNKDGSGFTVLHSFTGDSGGYYPEAGLLEGSDGALYGTTTSGDGDNYGSVFKINKDGSGYTTLKSFTWSGNGGKGEGVDGSLYGATQFGGSSGNGTVFRIDKDGSNYSILHDFIFLSEGRRPATALMQATNGLLYGVASGYADGGTVFTLTTVGTGFAVLGGTVAGSPQGPVWEGGDGALYATTSSGGTSNQGSVLKINKDGTGYTVLRSFVGDIDDALSPAAGMIKASDGALYGTTQSGGAGVGTIFKINEDGSDYAVTYRFSTSGGDGDFPGGLTATADGTLYGTTEFGGTRGEGSVFKMLPDGSGYEQLRSFTYAGYGAGRPQSLIPGSDGLLYGFSATGGSNIVGIGVGTIFVLNTNGGDFAILKHLSLADGTTGMRTLIEATDGSLYATAYPVNGSIGGTLFKLNKDGTGFTVLRSFASGSNGRFPVGLVEASDGVLYGTTSLGGTSDRGTIFKINKDGTGFSVLRSFTGTGGDAQGPNSLIEATDGSLYGQSRLGGSEEAGTVFKINKDGTGFAILRSFHGGDGDGKFPDYPLLEAADGTLFGVTSDGGINGQGTVFKINKDGSDYMVMKRFNGGEGQNARGGLLQTSDESIYGMTRAGGDMGLGTVFRFSASPAAPSVLVSPQSRTNLVGSSVTFAITAAGTAPLAYQWQFNDADINGAVATNYTIASVHVTNAGSYRVVITNSFGSVTSMVATLTVLSNNLPFVANPIPDQTNSYGGEFNFTFTANTFTNSDAGQTLSYGATGLPPGISFTPATRHFSGTNTSVGSYSITVTATDNGTPSMNTNDTFDLVVEKAALVARADDQSRGYGETNPPLTFSYSGFVLDETAAVFDTPPTAHTTATNGSPVGTYPITLTGGADDHYSFSYSNGTLTVTTAALTVTANDTNRVQGAANPTFTGTLVGLVNGDNITALFTTAATPASAPGIYPIIAELQDPDTKLGNYTVTTNHGSLTIFAPPTVSLVATGGPGLLTLTWPAVPGGFELEPTETLSPSNWQIIANGVSESGGVKAYVVTNDFITSGRLFRLRLQ
jgi:autotransporter-associated beta strand protein/uncharacterized repeat protein (TIGR03803 family)